MRFKDSLVGKKMALRSPLPLHEVTKRINKTSGSIFWPFGSGVVGHAIFGRIHLRYQSGPFEYNAKPILAGKAKDAFGATDLDMAFRSPRWVVAFFVFWYAFLILMTSLLTYSVVASDNDVGTVLPFFIILPIFVILPVGIHTIMTWKSEDELALLLDFLEREVQAKPCEQAAGLRG